jgi:hypothetical protein
VANRPNKRGFGHLLRLPSKRWQASYVGPDLADENGSGTDLRQAFQAPQHQRRTATTAHRNVLQDHVHIKHERAVMTVSNWAA